MASEKEKLCKIKIPLYKCHINIWICSPKVAFEKHKKTIYYDEDTVFQKEGGNIFITDGVDSIIWIDNCGDRIDKISRLSHELLHATIYEFKHKGMYLENDNHECYTYYLQYIMEQALRKLKL